MRLGLDELMIVNPGPAPSAATSWFLGADGGIYRLDQRGEAALGDDETVPRYFLGDDGTLYETG